VSGGPGIRALLACDLDGRLLDAEGAPAPGIVEVLGELGAAGAPLAICTGRPLFSARRAAERLEADPVAYLCYHGALVVDPASGRRLRHLPLPAAEASALAVEALDHGLGVTVYDIDEPRELACTARETRSGAGRPRGPAPREDLVGPAVTRLILHGDPEAAARLLPDLVGRWRGSLRVEPIRPGLIGVFHAHADKGDAVRLIAAHLGVPLARIVACGDAEADESLLRVAGVRVAVGDAPQALRRLTDTVVSQTGLAATLRRVAGALL
jgi:hydroxymethylpyrimidine pyrophosphatase-like HAD family hydrolase